MNKTVTSFAAALSLAASAAGPQRLAETYAKLPMRFEVNQGQAGKPVRFVSTGPGHQIQLTLSEIRLSLGGMPVAMRFAGARADAQIEGVERLPGISNYYIGNDPEGWITGVPAYGKVRYRALYPGVDLILYGTESQLEYDLVVEPGADAGAICLRFSGAQQIAVEPDGDLTLGVKSGGIRQRKPAIYQEMSGVRQAVAGGYVMHGDDTVGFEIGRYDHSRPLVIDPVIACATFLGGSGADSAAGVALDSTGAICIFGGTFSGNFPLKDAIQASNKSAKGTVFAAKLDPTGSSLIYSTYIGGSNGEAPGGVAADAAGNVYISGNTGSSDFPTKNPFQGSLAGAGNSAFVTKLDPTGQLIYSTYLGSGVDVFGNISTTFARGIAVDSAGNAYVTGNTSAAQFPTVRAYQSSLPLTQSVFGTGFVAKFDPTGAKLLYSTYLGGSEFGELGTAIAVDAAGSAYVTGQTYSADFPVSRNAAQGTFAGHNIFKSVDAGISFVPRSKGVISGIVTTLTVDPKDGSTVYAGTTGRGYFRSTDARATWTAINTGLPFNTVPTDFGSGLAADPANPGTVYCIVNSVLGSSSVYKSVNHGDTWLSVSNSLPGGQYFYSSIVIAPTTPTTIYLAAGEVSDGLLVYSALGGVFRSTDGGQTWGTASDISLFTFVQSLIIDPANPKTAYAGANSGVYKSIDGGNTWSLKPGAPAGLQVLSLTADPATSTLFAGTINNGIFKSPDGGATWASASAGLPATLPIQTLAEAPANPATLYAGTVIGVFSSNDGGAHWSAIRGSLPVGDYQALAVDPHSASTVYAGTQTLPDAFVTKLSPAGTGLVYSTYLGGFAKDQPNSIAVDAAGNAYITGNTASTDFPTHNAYQSALAGGFLSGDAFVTKLDGAGQFVYSTYLGGSGEDAGIGIAVDSAGNAYVGGATGSPDFPNPAAQAQTAAAKGPPAFVAKFSPDGSALRYSYQFGGGSGQAVNGIALDGSGRPVIVGSTSSADFPISGNALQHTYAGGSSDAFVAILESTAPVFQAAGVVSAASFLAGAVSPGELITIFGSRLGAAGITHLQVDSHGRVSTELGQTRVLFDGTAAPLVFTSAGQLAAIVPYEVAGHQSTVVEVEYQGERSDPVTLMVTQSAPALFTANASGKGAGAILNADLRPNSPANPAKRGAVIVLYGTGEGQTTPGGVDGQIAGATLPKPLLPVSVKIGGVDAKADYAGAAPALVAGVFQINVKVPKGVTPGNAVSVEVTIGTTGSQPVTVAVE